MRPVVLIALAGLVFAVGPRQSSAASVLGGTVEYSKSGGIAGISESMRIDRNGRGTIGRVSFKLPSRTARSLASALRRADLARVKSPKRAGCCDMFEYAIGYRGQRVRWDDGSSEQIPERVLELQSRLAELYERYG